MLTGVVSLSLSQSARRSLVTELFLEREESKCDGGDIEEQVDEGGGALFPGPKYLCKESSDTVLSLGLTLPGWMIVTLYSILPRSATLCGMIFFTHHTPGFPTSVVWKTRSPTDSLEDIGRS